MPRLAHPVPLPWIRVDRSLGIPAERQICGALRQAIRQGLVQPGFRLPSVRQLALDLDVSRRVVTNAYERLGTEGYVASSRGGATCVSMVAAAPRRVTSSLRASSRARAMPPLPPDGLLAPGSVALDSFPWRSWQRRVPAHSDLRETIAAHVAPMRGIVASAEEIVLTAGREQALECAARLLTDPGDLAILENPGDPRTRALLEDLGLRCRADRLDSEGLVFDATSEAPRVIHVSPSRHYPAGVQMTPGRQYLLLQHAKSVDAAILEEDRDGDGPALRSIDNDGRVVYIGSFEKTLLPHLGVAFLIVPRVLAENAARIAVPPSSLTASALADFIARGELARHVARMRPLYEERRDALTSALHRRLGGALLSETRGASLDLVLWLPPDWDDATIAATARQHGVTPLPLSACAAGGETFPPALVVGYGGVTAGDATVAVDRLAEAIERCHVARRHA